MLDRQARATLQPVLDRVALVLAKAGVSAGALTAAGLVIGLAAAVAAAFGLWPVALVLWLVSRTADGLDGAVARRTGTVSDRGGYLDIVSDFAVYGAFVVGCSVGRPDARLALIVLLLTYYINGTAFLAFSSIAERRAQRTGLEDGRSLIFLRGLAEGTETVIAHAAMVLLPGAMATIAWTFAAIVAVTIGQRVALGGRLLGAP